jgi:hypothetical protein
MDRQGHGKSELACLCRGDLKIGELKYFKDYPAEGLRLGRPLDRLDRLFVRPLSVRAFARAALSGAGVKALEQSLLIAQPHQFSKGPHQPTFDIAGRSNPRHKTSRVRRRLEATLNARGRQNRKLSVPNRVRVDAGGFSRRARCQFLPTVKFA